MKLVYGKSQPVIGGKLFSFLYDNPNKGGGG